ncbi:MAG TPA: hypothetical protein O0Y06_06480 [Methanocorpusculum sp.]|nr:hypothetical protein [Methanocorpusculum sp.]HJK80531.1 hypothetical protein [Methanocorpusculum sp.]
MIGSGTIEDPYLLPESTYIKYKDEFPKHAARILKNVRDGKVIIVKEIPA